MTKNAENIFTALRWPDGITRPRCKGKSVSTIAERDQCDCDACRYQFSVTSGTIFHDSHLPLCEVYNPLMILWENGFTVPCMRRSSLLIWSVWEHQNYIMRPPIAME
jgi:transposase-like protein